MFQGKFAFLPACKIGTFHRKMNIRMSVQNLTFRLLALHPFIKVKLFVLCMFLSDALREQRKTFDLERRTVQKITFCLCVWKPIQPENFSSSVLLNKPMNIRKQFVFQQAMGINSWGKTKNGGVAG